MPKIGRYSKMTKLRYPFGGGCHKTALCKLHRCWV
uniref:Uncharacterized protein n=1 Tax=Ackermannviridae sp. TaxID=2831612 RepID=A0A8S5VJZ6_9CAUD|nr:MAG TPA: hypothetical protein [Ackermannviridae sp.]